MFKNLTIECGIGKDKKEEKIKNVHIKVGQIYSIVGYTGSGKSQLIQDIEQLVQGESVTKRRIYLDGRVPNLSLRYDSNKKIVAHLSQNMNFMLDMKVSDFLKMHAKCREVENVDENVQKVLVCANNLAGEKIEPEFILTELSGGQSRALMIADVAINGNAPIVLIDEIENAGIDKLKAMNTLLAHEKIILLVTHDPILALLGDKRIIMKNGAIQNVISTSNNERKILDKLREISSIFYSIQKDLRCGKVLEDSIKI